MIRDMFHGDQKEIASLLKKAYVNPKNIIGSDTLVLSMPAHRTFVPDADVLGRAALLSGMLSRLQSYANDRKLRALHDCVLFLQAQKLGFAVLTANNFDCSPSAPLRQIEGLHEGRISGSS